MQLSRPIFSISVRSPLSWRGRPHTRLRMPTLGHALATPFLLLFFYWFSLYTAHSQAQTPPAASTENAYNVTPPIFNLESLPDAPQPTAKQSASATYTATNAQLPRPCSTHIRLVAQSGGSSGHTASSAQPLIPDSAPIDLSSGILAPPDPCMPAKINWFERFLNGPEVKPLTTYEKFRLAIRNVLDPFNGFTILLDDGINVAADPDSPYGPGLRGFAKNVGVSYTQVLSGELFCTFLVPALVGQDPHYHRMPNASISRRALHAIDQIVWTQSDRGRGMINFGTLIGGAGVLELSNLYVPDQQTNLPSSAQRYAVGIGTAPIANLITEFLPDVARHIHIQEVIIQRLVNKIANSDQSQSQ